MNAQVDLLELGIDVSNAETIIVNIALSIYTLVLHVINQNSFSMETVILIVQLHTGKIQQKRLATNAPKIVKYAKMLQNAKFVNLISLKKDVNVLIAAQKVSLLKHKAAILVMIQIV
jgi:hypothetical protein